MTHSDASVLADGCDVSVPMSARIVDLPPPNVKRWGIRRKAAVVRAIEEGVITFSAACERYDLSSEELESWIRRAGTHGVGGLRVTRLTDYRSLERDAEKPAE